MGHIINIGDKNEFSIDIQILGVPGRFSGYTRIFVKNNPIGTWGDSTYLDLLYNVLMNVQDLSNNTYIRNNLYSFGSIDAFHKLGETKAGSKMLLGLGENFDDFDIKIFQYCNDTYFLWKLVDKPYFVYDEIQPDKIFYEKINSKKYYSILQEFSAILNRIDDPW
jgi:hypothetical protein